MTPTEALAVFGSELSGEYFNGSDYTPCTFTYDTTTTIFDKSIGSGYSWGEYLSASGTTWLVYRSNFSANTNPQYVTVEVRPTYSIFDTSQIHTCIALSSGGNANTFISTTYQSPAWDWYIGGTNVHLENSATSYATSVRSWIKFNYDKYVLCSYVPLDFTSQSKTSGYSLRADFYGNTGNNGYILLLGCPYVDSDSTASEGTFTTGGGSGGGDINVNVTVDVDLSDTNSKIDGVAGAVQAVKDLLEGDSSDYPPLTSLIPLGTYPMTFDSDVVEDGLQALDDVPDELAAGGFWFKLSYDLLHLSPLWLLLPLLMTLALARYVIWRG